jgi:RecA/RadA recombinase
MKYIKSVYLELAEHWLRRSMKDHHVMKEAQPTDDEIRKMARVLSRVIQRMIEGGA